MSNDPEALAPQTDATVSSSEAQPDGTEQKQENEAAPSAAVTSKTSETIEPETNRLNERFAELTKLRRDAERRETEQGKQAEFWRQRALQYEKPEVLPTVEGVKTLADFQFDEGRHQAYIEQRAAKSAAEAAKREIRAENEAREKQRRTAEYLTRVKDFAKDKPDFNGVVNNDDLRISEQIAETLIGVEQGPELAYYLGKNPDIAQQVSAIPDREAAYQLGMIAARLKYERDTANKAKNIVSQAPPPTARIDAGDPGTSNSRPDDPDSDKLSDAEWARRRNKQIAKRSS